MDVLDSFQDWSTLTPEQQKEMKITYCYRQIVDPKRWGVFHDWKKFCGNHVADEFAGGGFGGSSGGLSGSQEACHLCDANACDRLALHPLDREVGIAGVPLERIEPQSAQAACRAAVINHPNVGRLKYNLARALLASGDMEQFRVHLEHAARSGYDLAQNSLGYAYLGSEAPFGQVTDVGNVKRDDRQAAAWFMRSAVSGDLYGQAMLGWLFATGRGVKKSDPMARFWWERAAANYDPRYDHIRLYTEDRLRELAASGARR